MTLPASWTQVEVSGQLLKPNGSPHVGTVAFSSAQRVVVDGVVMVPHVQFVRLDGDGRFTITLPSTDDPSIQPTGWIYTVQEYLPRASGPRSVLVPGTSPTIDYADLEEVVPVVNADRTRTVTNVPSVTPDVSLEDTIAVLAQGQPLTVNDPIGTLKQGTKLLLRIEDDGTARALTFGSIYRAHVADLPDFTVVGRSIYVAFMYDANDGKFDCLAVV